MLETGMGSKFFLTLRVCACVCFAMLVERTTDAIIEMVRPVVPGTRIAAHCSLLDSVCEWKRYEGLEEEEHSPASKVPTL
ncbi:uncharacterized protein BDZ83DRAFT_602136 [Colletotrichum acutatum]|uniref:Secreted protein n=1 Tax=Glomerella acutata TaxID=27357 RepID=A0AAD8XMY2_GLOAC|nr:uncharacterized protein BDZ83DRAFT_602136 [Colletotrichum acutatum]KAK1730263.1 hypothetical protein BDZ83DRAFT_602136 [Colletotrichum acutatum]